MQHFASALIIMAFPVAPQPVLAQATSFVCSFDTECSRDEGCQTKDMSLTFFIDEQGNAYMQGNIDLVQVMPLVGDSAISFVQPVNSGIVQSTSILNDGRAAHSRHTAFLDEFVVSQWHGTCLVFGGEQ